MLKYIVALTLTLFAFACGGTEYDVEDELQAEQELNNQIGTTGADGGACKVTSGTHAGKTGTYETDDDGVVWCSGDWGSTDCSKGACTSASIVRPRVYTGGTSGTLYNGP